MQIPARKPTATAMAAATLDVLSEGRFRLGLGLSGPQVSEGWYGEPFVRNLRRVREYVDVVRRVLAREAVSLPLPEGEEGMGLGKPLKLLAKPVQERIPVYLGAVGPEGDRADRRDRRRLAARVPRPGEPGRADGPAARGAARAGRDASSIDVAAAVPVAVTDDLDAARDACRPWLAFYLGAMGAKEKNFYVDLADRYGHGDVAREVQERMLGGDRAGAAAALTPELIDATALVLHAVRARRAARGVRGRAGVTTLLAVPSGDRAATVRALAAAGVTA